jgi:hypothetical protein
VARYREKQKLLLESCNVTSNVTVTDCNADRIDKNRVDKSREDKSRYIEKRTRFVPPTVDEVKAYAQEKGWNAAQFDAERFVDFYTSKGWKVGKDQMKDWKACARGWVSRGKAQTPASTPTSTPTVYTDPDYENYW